MWKHAIYRANHRKDNSNSIMIEDIYQLLTTWGKGLQRYQMKATIPGGGGGIFCPACCRIHGRSIDTIYPFITLFRYTNNHTYLQSAKDVYGWSQQLRYPNGSYGNDLHIVEWNGITVFNLITLLSTVLDHGSVLPIALTEKWKNDCEQMSDFVYKNFTIKTGNINYPASAIYALYLAYLVFKDKKYLDRAQALKNEILPYFTSKQSLLYGEGYPQESVSKKGARPIDVAYNIDESLTHLGLFSTGIKDKKLISLLIRSFKTHTNFFLEDGAVDNSWCSRNYKWSYWGSRTSDGCQLGLLHFSKYLPELIPLAKQNLKLLKEATNKNILYGGLGYREANEYACIHHTICHAKNLAKLYFLLKKKEISLVNKKHVKLKRFPKKHIKVFSPDSSNVQIVQNETWRATISDYDWQYCKGSTPTGGALTLLFAKKWGPLIASGLNHAVMPERFNMQDHINNTFIGATPRIECFDKDNTHLQSIDYLAAITSSRHEKDFYQYRTSTKLANQLTGTILDDCIFDITYTLKEDQTFTIDYNVTKSSKQNMSKFQFALPLIIRAKDKVSVSEHEIRIQNQHGIITVNSKTAFSKEYSEGFNYQPGFVFRVFYCKMDSLKPSSNQITFHALCQ